LLLLRSISSLLAFLIITLFVLSLGVLLFELTLTRIFSIILWYDYAFMAISVAFFGLGIGALIVHILKYKIIDKGSENIPQKILQCAIAFAISIPIFLFLIGYVIPPNISFIYLFYLISSIPFFFAGMSMALAYLSMPREISKLYFVDLAGAAGATIVLESLMQWLGAESVLLLTAVIVVVSVFSTVLVLHLLQQHNRLKLPSENAQKTIITTRIIGNKTLFFGMIIVSAVSGLLVVNIINSNILAIPPGENKGLARQIGDSSIKHLSTEWNSFSRVDVTSNTKDSKVLASIIIDADAVTPIFRWNSSSSSAAAEADNRWIKKYMDYMPYEISQANSTLVIGGGGGEDILVALVGGSKNITVVEINPLVISATKKFGGSSAGNLYERKDVRLFIDDGRRFISSTDIKYDRIIIKLVDSWAAQLAGGYALSENYLYTVEAFRQYLRHLNEDNGMLVMVRWNFELPRLMPLVVESLRQEKKEGISTEDIRQQILVVEDRPGLYFGSNKERTLYPVLLVIKNKPFTDYEINLIKDRIIENDAKVIAMPGEYIQHPYNRLFFSGSSLTYEKEKQEQQNSQLQKINDGFSSMNLDMKIPTDDSPFYFAKEPIPKQMIILLITVLGVSAVLALLLIYYSRLTKKKKRNAESIILSLSNQSLPFYHIAFVICIGLGFMFIEITFIQKFLLLLGTPILALTVILFCILLSSSIGAYLSGRLFSKSPYKAIVISIPILAGILLLYFGYLHTIINSSINLEIQHRIALTFGLLFPTGLLMGFQFPSIARMASLPPTPTSYTQSSSAQSHKRRSTDNHQDITLLWGINIIASVVGTVLTAISSMVIGFSGNIIIGLGLYLAALVSVLIAAKSTAEKDAQSIIR
jgi:Spermine/spermidine synthase domain